MFCIILGRGEGETDFKYNSMLFSHVDMIKPQPFLKYLPIYDDSQKCIHIELLQY